MFKVIKAKNFSKLMTDTEEQIQEAQKPPSRIITCLTYQIQTEEYQTQRENIERNQKKEHLTSTATRMRATVNFLSVTTQTRRKWSEVSKVLKENPTKLEFYIH